MSGCFFETQCRPCSPTSVLVTVFIIVWLCNIITQHTDDSNNCQWALHQQKKYVLLATVSAKISILCKHKQHTCILLGRSAYTQCIKMRHTATEVAFSVVVSVSVCVYVWHTCELCKMTEPIEMLFPCIRWWSRSPMRKNTFEGDVWWPIVTYLHLASAPAQCMRPMNAFTATRGDKTRQRCSLILAKLLWTCVILRNHPQQITENQSYLTMSPWTQIQNLLQQEPEHFHRATELDMWPNLYQQLY